MKALVTASLWCAVVSAAAGQRPSLAELEARVSADSNDPVLHYHFGAELARQQQTEGARRALITAVRIDPKFAPAWGALLRLDPSFKRPTLAVRLDSRGRFQLVVVRPSDSVRVISRRVFFLNPLLDVTDGSRYPVPAGWEGTLAKGMRAFREGDWAEAEKRFGGVIAKTSGKGRRDDAPAFALWYHALTQVELSRLDVAIQDVERLLNASLRDSTPRGWSEAFGQQYTLAYLHQLAGHVGEAERIYRTLLEDRLGLELVHLRLAQVLEAQARWDEAVAERRHAANANPDDPSLVFDLGMALHNAGYNAEAVEVLDRALAANPRETRAHLILGAALQAEGRPAEAREHYTHFLDLAPRRFTTLADDARRRLAELTAGP